MVKTYIFTGAIYRSRVIRVTTKDRQTLVEFNGGGLNLANPNCFFITSDKLLQEALEKHPLFDVSDGFVLLRSESDGTPDAPTKETVKEIAEVKSFIAAKEYILKNFEGYTQADVSSAEKIRALAEKLKIAFPNWSH
jgi:hypothetical protein